MQVFSTTALPLTLVDFNGKYIRKNAAQLLWITTSEVNTDHFEVERSESGVSFIKRGVIKAKGNNGSEENYNYIDTVSTYGALFYRLKIVDKNLQYTYSKTILLNQNEGQQSIIKIYPNPVEENFTALFHTEVQGQYTFNLYNSLGRLIDSKSITAVKGDNFIHWNMQHFASGHYMLKAENTGIPATGIIKK